LRDRGAERLRAVGRAADDIDALWRLTACAGRPAMSRTGYCNVERVMLTEPMRPF
jgi:hypothetical protein